MWRSLVSLPPPPLLLPFLSLLSCLSLSPSLSSVPVHTHWENTTWAHTKEAAIHTTRETAVTRNEPCCTYFPFRTPCLRSWGILSFCCSESLKWLKPNTITLTTSFILQKCSTPQHSQVLPTSSSRTFLITLQEKPYTHWIVRLHFLSPPRAPGNYWWFPFLWIWLF